MLLCASQRYVNSRSSKLGVRHLRPDLLPAAVVDHATSVPQLQPGGLDAGEVLGRVGRAGNLPAGQSGTSEDGGGTPGDPAAGASPLMMCGFERGAASLWDLGLDRTQLLLPLGCLLRFIPCLIELYQALSNLF